MTREEFAKYLDYKGYSYKIEGDMIIVTHKVDVDLGSLETIPPGVEFRNTRGVYLNRLKTISSGVVFKNGMDVWLGSLETLPSGVEFMNGDDVHLNSLIGGWFAKSGCNIHGIEHKRLLNFMISKGIFER